MSVSRVDGEPFRLGHTNEPRGKIREHLARELHDSVAQTLTSMVVSMENFKRDQFGRQHVVDEVTSFQTQTREILDNIRQLLYDLRGEPALHGDLATALHEGLLKDFAARSGSTVHLYVASSWPKRLSSTSFRNLYRFLQEALNDAQARAAKAVTIELAMPEARRASITVMDDGEFRTGGASTTKATGRLGISERALLLGATLEMSDRETGHNAMRATFALGHAR